MTRQSYAEEQTKIAKEAAFAALGRAIGELIEKLVDLRRAELVQPQVQPQRTNNPPTPPYADKGDQMTRQSYAEEQTKIAKEAAFAALGRAIADAAHSKSELKILLQDAAVRREQEQNGGTRSNEFAALVRQIGDAINNQKPIGELIEKLVDLRRAELVQPQVQPQRTNNPPTPPYAEDHR